jgi:DNA-binding transcriptional LysR family regulator
MTLGQLRAFLAFVDAGSVRAAAERLVVTQPAVSMAIASLQRSVGVALTLRDGRGLRLSPAGETFAGYARDVVALVDAGVEAAAGRSAPEQGTLRLAAVTTAAENVMPSFLAAFRQRFPEVQIHLEVGNRTRVWDLLAHHEVDVVVGGRPPASQPFVVGAMRDNELVLVAPASRPAVSAAADLAVETWLLREPGSGTRGAVVELIEQLGIDPPTLTLGSNGAIRQSVEAGLGIAVLSRDAVARQLGRGALVEWSVPPFPVRRPWHVVTRADRPVPATAELFLTHLLESGFSKPSAPASPQEVIRSRAR